MYYETGQDSNMKDWQARFGPQAIIWEVKYGIDTRFAAIQLWSILKTIAIMTSQTQNFLISWLFILDSKSFQIIF